MNIRLSPGLQKHRWGRLLANVLGLSADGITATPADAQPALVLMIGEELVTATDQAGWIAWARQPGHMLLLIPPYREGVLTEEIDWQLFLLPEPPQAVESYGPAAALARALAPEVGFVLHGVDGESEREAGHVWRDGTLNTRFWKAHANSGLLAATCLPLASLSLLGKGDELRSWMQVVHRHVGRGRTDPPRPGIDETPAPTQQEWAVLLGCFASGLGTPQALRQALAAQPVPVLRLDGYDLPALFEVLSQRGWLAEDGVTEAGMALLHGGPYWRYAEQLKELMRS